MQISYLFLAVFTPNKTVNKLHWTRTIKSHHSNNVFKRSRLQSAQISFHSRRFQLEYTSRVAALKQLVGLFVIKRQLRKINFFLVSFSDNPHGIINDRKVRKPQKVHLKKTKLFNLTHRELSCHHALLRHFKRNIVSQCIWRNHHATGMNAMATNRPFQLNCIVQNFLRGRIIFILIPKIRILFNTHRQRNMTPLVWRRN